MIDLAARIADAVKAIDDDGKRYVTVKIAVDRWLFLDMAARIEELEKALKPFAKAWEAGGERDASPQPVDFRTAARAYRGEKG
jgi:hypothetical protein